MDSTRVEDAIGRVCFVKFGGDELPVYATFEGLVERRDAEHITVTPRSAFGRGQYPGGGVVAIASIREITIIH